MLPFAPPTLLTLDADILTLIIELLSIEDARNFRLCSKRAACFAAAHALSRQELRLAPKHTVKRVDELLQQQAGRLTLVRCLIIKIECFMKLDRDIANAVLRLLSKTPGARELSLSASEALLGLSPDLLDAIACLPHLRKLTLRGSNANVSTWFLRGGDIPLAKTLTHLTLDLLDLSDQVLGARPPPQLLSLRTLCVDTVKGRLAHLVTIAPLLQELTVTFVPAYFDVVLPISDDKTGWTTLTAVTGHIDSLYRLLPLFRSSICAVAVTGHINDREDAQCIQPVLHALQPTCLEFACRLDYRLACQHLTSEPQYCTYLGLRAPMRCQWRDTLSAFSKKFTALRCLDIDMCDANLLPFRPKRPEHSFRASFAGLATYGIDGGAAAEPGSVSLAHEVHYLSCKMPTLRFLLSHGTSWCPRGLFDYPGTPAPGTTRGVAFKVWKKASRISDWQHGRREAILSEAEAQRIRDAFRQGTPGARLISSGELIL